MKKIFGLLLLMGILSNTILATNYENLVQSFGYKTNKWLPNEYKMALDYKADILGNAVGGIKRAIEYDHSIGFDFQADLNKLIKWKGWSFDISAVARTGQNLSANDIGNTFNASSLYGSEELRLYGLTLNNTHKFNQIKGNFKIGRVSAGDDFNRSDLYWLIINNAIDGNPISVFSSSAFSSYPGAVWGTVYNMKFTKDALLPKNSYFRIGAYDSDTTISQPGSYGINFSLAFKNGLFIPVELGYNIDDDIDTIYNMPGSYRAGFYDSTGYTGDSTYLRKTHNNWGAYLQFDQMVYRETFPDLQGLRLFGGVNWQPAEYNKIPLFLFGGFIYKGIVVDRDEDETSFGFSYGRWSWDINKTVNPKEYEMMFDISYKFHFNDWLYVQPDFQYIICPVNEAGTRIENSMVFGGRVGMIFL